MQTPVKIYIENLDKQVFRNHKLPGDLFKIYTWKNFDRDVGINDIFAFLLVAIIKVLVINYNNCSDTLLLG
jgi:hypothetical protein